MAFNCVLFKFVLVQAEVHRSFALSAVANFVSVLNFREITPSHATFKGELAIDDAGRVCHGANA